MTTLREAIAGNRASRGRYPRKRLEHDFQVTLSEYLEQVLPAEAVWFSIDHAGGGKIGGALRKRRGVIPGIADAYIAYRTTTLWIECKAPKGRLGDDQVAFRDAVLAIGHHWTMAKSLEDAHDALLKAAIPIRRVALLPCGVIYTPVKR